MLVAGPATLTQPRELLIAILVLATVSALVACGTISGMRPTVLIVDDHAAFRASARALLQAKGFEVIGEATDGTEAVEAVAVLRPQIVLLDIQLPDLDGLAVAEQLARAAEAPAVVLISSRDAAAYGPRLQATPARGFIPKQGLSGEALAALTGQGDGPANWLGRGWPAVWSV
jgi:CheY-like chemotaxis protein